MTDPPPLDQHGEELLRRWAVNPTPRNALDLAEEYRRLNRWQDGVKVLLQTLRSHPGHLASRVALGRFQLGLGQHDKAAEALEGVVEQDPTHLVANKVLVDLYMEIGERKKARDRLDLYRLLNESDPEIESLQAKLDGSTAEEVPADKARATPVEEPEVAESAVPAEAVASAEMAEAKTLMASLETLAPQVETEEALPSMAGEPAAARPEEVAESAPPAAPEAKRKAPEVPFDLAPVTAPALDLQSPGFPVAADLATPPASAGIQGEEIAVFVADPNDEPFARISEGLDLGEHRGPAGAESIFPLVAAPPESSVASADAVEGGHAVEPGPALLTAAETLPEIEVEEEAAPPAAPASAKAAEAEAPVPEPPAPVTATLAELYLEQGHLAEAEQAFREVLVREPDHDLARQRLADIRRRRSPRLTATEMLVDAAPDLGLEQRRVHLLKSYLRRIRAKAEATET